MIFKLATELFYFPRIKPETSGVQKAYALATMLTWLIQLYHLRKLSFEKVPPGGSEQMECMEKCRVESVSFNQQVACFRNLQLAYMKALMFPLY